MRGKDQSERGALAAFRITPAYAGKGCARELLLIVSRDHPRVCGERTFTVRNVEGVEGSPPRMRGKERNDEHNI